MISTTISSPLYAIPSSIVILTIKAENLRNRDYFSKSDPMCVVFQLNERGERCWREVGRTEQIKNNLSPEWAKTITLDYLFEEKQPLQFGIYDIDSHATNLEEHDFLGQFECDLAEVVSLGTLTAPLHSTSGKHKCGSLTITSEELDDGIRENIVFNVRGEKLDKKDFFGKSDPFLNIYRHNSDGSRTLVHRTEHVRKTLNPTWQPFEINLKTLCDGDITNVFRIECWDNDDDASKSHDFIGGCSVRVNQMLDTKDTFSIPLINEKKQLKKGKNYSNSGTLFIQSARSPRHTFLDFISGGTQLDFAVAVDFTASNGAVHKESSLHYISPVRPNQYEVAIRSVLEICQYYNNSKVFDSYGFGAIIPPSNVVSPLFDLDEPKGTVSNPSVTGTEGVLAAYRHCLHKVQLYGPTNFSPIINEVAKRTAARNLQTGSRYQILLIITDGAISDLQKTKRTLINAAHLPLSIIIVGVGNADFDAMNELDGDTSRLSVDGRISDRDIVQFVPLRDFINRSTEADPEKVMALLAKEVLAEVPTQLTSFMKKYNISPRSPERRSQVEHSNGQQPALPSAPPMTEPHPIGFQLSSNKESQGISQAEAGSMLQRPVSPNGICIEGIDSIQIQSDLTA